MSIESPAKRKISYFEQEKLNEQLYRASETGDNKTVTKLLKEGADINYKHLGRTVLGIAAAKGHTETVQLLISRQEELDINKRGIREMNALHLSCCYGHINCSRLLVDAGIDLQATNESSRNAMHWACENDHIDLIKYLLGRGLSLDSPQDKNGKTPRMMLNDTKEDVKQFLEELKSQDNTETPAATESTDTGGKDQVQILKQQLKDRKDELEQLSQEMQLQKLQHQRELQQVFQEKQEIIQQIDHAVTTAVQEKNETIEQKERLIHEQQVIIRRKDDLVRQKDDMIRRKDDIIQQQKDDFVQQMDDIIQQKDDLIREKQVIIRQKDDLIQDKDDIIQQKQVIISNLERELQERPWILGREEVKLTKDKIGGGAYGEVKVAIFRGTRVAAKCLHEIIVSDYNQGVFIREMEISARIHHPNIVQFIGATRVDNPILLYELMTTSLHKQLQEGRPLTRPQIITIASDICTAMCYLHQWRPDPIIHRDISSPNVLMEPLPNDKWRAKISDFGSANLELHIKTVMPGNPAYAAPEALIPQHHSPAMDVYSFGVLVAEMILKRPPSTVGSERELHIRAIDWVEMRTVLLKCINNDHRQRLSSEQLLSDLQKLLL